MRTLVVGMGRQGKRRLDALQKCACEVTGVDSDPSSPFYQNQAEIAEWIRKADAVVVATPSNTHYEVAGQAMMLGKHVLVEKPPALTHSDAVALCSIARSNQVGLHIGLNMRYRDPIMRAKELLPRLGGVHEVRGYIGHSQFMKDPSNPRCKFSGGPMIDQGIHGLDLILHLMNRPKLSEVSVKQGRDWMVKDQPMDGSLHALAARKTKIELTCSFLGSHGVNLSFKCEKGNLSVVMGEQGDLLEFDQTNSIPIQKSFPYPDRCWEIDCEEFLLTCRTRRGNAEEAAEVLRYLTKN